MTSLDCQLSEERRLKVDSSFVRGLTVYNDPKTNCDKIVLCGDGKRVFVYDIISPQECKEDFKSPEQDRQVTATTTSDDLIFFAVGSEVKAISNKGKEVYSFDTFLAETVRMVRVHGFKMWVIGESLLNEFEMGEPALINKKSRRVSSGTQKTRESSYYLSEDKINDAFIFRQQAEGFCVILRENCQLQLIDKGQVRCFLKTESAPLCCGDWQPKEASDGQQTNLIGLSSGNLLIVETSVNSNNKRAFKKLTQIVAPGNKIVSVLEISKGILLCRSNQLEVWSRNEEAGFELRWQKPSQDAVVQCVGLRSSDTILYCTYSGKLLCLDVVDSNLRIKRPRESTKEKQQDLRPVVDGLHKLIQTLEAERERLKAALVAKTGPKMQKYRLNHSVSLNPSLQSYKLELSCSLPIIRVVFDGNIRLKTDLSVTTFQDKPKDPKQPAQTKYIVSFESGELNPSFEYVVSESSENGQLGCYLHLQGEREIVVLVPLEVKCLALHIKTDNKLPSNFSKEFVTIENRKDLNRLLIGGRFTKIEMNSWLGSIFDVPKSLAEGDKVVMVHESVATRQKVLTEFSEDEAIITAENLTPLVLIRKAFAKKSKERETAVKLKLEPNPLAVEATLKALEPKLLEYEKIEKQFKLLPGLLEISSQESEAVGERFRDVVQHQQSIRQSEERNRGFYSELKSNIMELYSSYQVAKEQEVNDFQRENLSKKLSSFKLQEVLQIITG